MESLYDGLGRLIRKNSPDGSWIEMAYSHERTKYKDSGGSERHEWLDPYGRIARVTEYLGPTHSFDTAYAYDPLGNLVGVTDALYNQTHIFYDSLSRKIGIRDPVMGEWSYGYDSNGNLKTQTDAKSQTITFHYDSLNRLVQKDYPEGTDVSYVYDNEGGVLGGSCPGNTNHKGNLSKVTDASGESAFCYDFAGRVVSSFTKVDDTVYSFHKTYNTLGLTTSITYPPETDPETLTYEYNNALGLREVKNDQVTYASFPDEWYNAAGQPRRVAYGNGVNTSLEYIPQNARLRVLKTTLSNGTDIQDFEYLYKDNQNNLNRGNLAGIIDNIPAGEDHPDQNQSFEYDDLNRLRLAHGPYGPGGSPGTLGYQINEIGNITSAPDNPPATGTVPNRSDQNQLLYDYDNRVTSITNIRGTTTFTYNDRGSRVKKTKGTSETVYLGKLLEMRDGTAIKHIFAGNRRIATKDGVETFYYHPDHLGSLNVATNSDGEVSQIVTYYPYGEIRTNDLKNNNPIDLPHKFTGQEYDNERGLYYFVARYYDPAAGRFITPDTIVQSPGDPQTLNRYAYARNNPLLYTDPSGRLFLIDDIIIGAIIGAAIGATSSAISGGDIGMSALTGAIGGAFFGAAGGIIENSIASAAQAAGISYQAAVQAGMGISTAGQVGLHAAAGIASGGINAAITGGDVGLGMLTGGLSGGIGKYAGGFIPNNFPAQLAGRSILGGITGGMTAAIYGGSFMDGFMPGATSAAIGTIANDWAHFLRRAQLNREMTDRFFDSLAGKGGKLLLGPVTKAVFGTTIAEEVAGVAGTVRLGQGLRSLMNSDMTGYRGLATLGAAGTVASMSLNVAISAFVGYAAFNAGLYVGSYVEAIPEIFR